MDDFLGRRPRRWAASESSLAAGEAVLQRQQQAGMWVLAGLAVSCVGFRFLLHLHGKYIPVDALSHAGRV